jgi:hypothetical protein
MSIFSSYEDMVCRLLRMFGTNITYKRRDVVIAENIRALPGHETAKIDRSNKSVRTSAKDKSYIIKTSLLTLNDKQIIPKSGDRIIDGIHEYEVTPNESQDCYYPMNNSESYIRIFCKKVS